MKPVQNVQCMKPVQYAQVSCFAHFSSLVLFNFEINGYFLLFFLFHFFFFFFFFFFFWRGGGGGFVEGDIGRFY